MYKDFHRDLRNRYRNCFEILRKRTEASFVHRRIRLRSRTKQICTVSKFHPKKFNIWPVFLYQLFLAKNKKTTTRIQNTKGSLTEETKYKCFRISLVFTMNGFSSRSNMFRSFIFSLDVRNTDGRSKSGVGSRGGEEGGTTRRILCARRRATRHFLRRQRMSGQCVAAQSGRKRPPSALEVPHCSTAVPSGF